MSREQIGSVEGIATLPLRQDILEALGLRIGDEIDLSLVEGQLVVRSLEEAERQRKLRTATDRIIDKRRSAYERLAEGPR